MDKIFLKGLSVKAYIGLLPEELAAPQTLLIDLEYATDVRLAASRDNIADADDYAAVREFVINFLCAHRFLLLETLAERLSAALLSQFSFQWLQLSLDKPTIFPDVDAVGVSIERGPEKR